MFLHKLASEHQPQATAHLLRVDSIGGTKETLEDMLGLGFRDTNAGIAYLDADLLGNLIKRS